MKINVYYMQPKQIKQLTINAWLKNSQNVNKDKDWNKDRLRTENKQEKTCNMGIELW